MGENEPWDDALHRDGLLVCERSDTVSQGRVPKWSVRTHGDGGGGGRDSAGSEDPGFVFTFFQASMRPVVFV